MSEAARATRPVSIIAKTSRRIAAAATIAIAVGLLLKIHSTIPLSTLLLRAVIVGLSATTAFTVFEMWPRTLPRWFQRWALQVVAVGVFMPVTTFLIYVLFTPRDAPPFWEESGRLTGWLVLTLLAMLVAPWTALIAIVRQKEAIVRDQNLAFALERSELERQALDARLHLLQAQVAPHFLFNTLANVQALVDAGSPHASSAAQPHGVPARRGAAAPRVGRDDRARAATGAALSRADADAHARSPPIRERTSTRRRCNVRCPPTTLLTLVENAVRHGIDPSEEGGRIDVDIARRGGRCVVRVTDTGAGLHQSANGLGTGLATLRERLRLIFG